MPVASIDSVWEDAAVRGTNTWLGVNQDWKVVERLAEARIAVAHGLGTLTRRQVRNEQSIREKLRLAGISLHGKRSLV